MAIRKITKAKETNFIALNNFLTTVASSQEEIKYDLIVSNDVSVGELYIGYTKILLKKDQDPADMNHFSSGSNSYKCTKRPEGINVIVIADGMIGGFWELKISIKNTVDGSFKNIIDHPIRKTTGNMGHLDHNQFHN